jgi:hypothetical protein
MIGLVRLADKPDPGISASMHVQCRRQARAQPAAISGHGHKTLKYGMSIPKYSKNTGIQSRETQHKTMLKVKIGARPP